jgi:hypothetical protein
MQQLTNNGSRSKGVVKEKHLQVSFFINRVIENIQPSHRKYSNYTVRNELTQLLTVM